MRTIEELLIESRLRRALGLPPVELTREERERAIGHPGLDRVRKAGEADAERQLLAIYDDLKTRGLKPPADMRRKVREILKRPP